MKRDVVLHVLQVDEAADLSVGVAGDVDQDGVDRRLLVEPVERRDREELLQGPVVEERLEDREIAHVLVGEERRQVVELLGLVAGLLALLGDLLADLPEDLLGRRAVLEVEVAQVEERKRLVLLLEGVVEALEAAELRLVLQQDLQVGHDLLLLLGLVLLAEGFPLVDPLEDLDHEHGVGGDHGAPGLAHDVRLRRRPAERQISRTLKTTSRAYSSIE